MLATAAHLHRVARCTNEVVNAVSSARTLNKRFKLVNRSLVRIAHRSPLIHIPPAE